MVVFHCTVVSKRPEINLSYHENPDLSKFIIIIIIILN